MTAYPIDVPKPGMFAKIGRVVLHEVREILPPTIFFFLGFNLILFTKRLILADHLIQFAGFAIATVGALVVGKAVLIADTMPFLRRFDQAPVAEPILFKTVVYTLFVFVARLIEFFLHHVFAGGALGHGAFVRDLLGKFSWDRFISTQLWIFVLFLIYVTASELNRLFGDNELSKILFTRRSSELKLTRRARIRLLVRLARLTDAYSIESLGDAATPQHAELVDILRGLARKPARV
jgi:hypothetical protein